MFGKYKLLFSFIGILILAAAAGWIVHPSGSSISLKPLKIPYQKDFKVRLGLDLQGGSHLVYEADFKDIDSADRQEALNAVRTTIERRVNSFGVSEPQVLVSGDNRVIVELPGITNIDDAIRQIGETPLLEFKTISDEALEAVPDENGTITVDPDSQWKSTGLSGKQLKKAAVDLQGGQGSISQVVVRLEFDDEGKDLFAEITSNNIGNPIAIFLDGQLLSAPTVQAAITSGTAVIEGNFSTQEAKDLATRLNSGALPVPINLISQQNVGATLGKESVQKSVMAGLIGLLIIGLFMILYYRLPGFISVLALTIYTLIAFAVFKIGISFTAVILVGLFFFLGLTINAWFGALGLLSYLLLMFLSGLSPVTLTLAGIAGFILSIGMAIDANILIFERFKEEVREGKDLDKAVDDGFDRAWLSIRDSNVSSLITTVILYLFGTPSIRGFAITLGIGILISMFTAITVTRVFLKLAMKNKILSHRQMLGVSKTTNKNNV
ncbi:MAG: protein translocase subunit SecD [Candidatus Doudnabacteria bacterium CG10_big_fil_rev_8_21_14_0_10_42_18]|uniref:Protein translocase subunit SecD n=1 Tax=Candidatus Doudnabacteria bacterium CG10_big_fil_rev_8_21_14_0_10_42_18 TaxID=1974552 RepID=A0A2H0VAZ0_9BACT|nr:MAG: protein translocase subunit SecD [Candidatus Doudnabacteria bacterium CG10_big_fil_rev_8_21_14_0_10_42_18]